MSEKLRSEESQEPENNGIEKQLKDEASALSKRYYNWVDPSIDKKITQQQYEEEFEKIQKDTKELLERTQQKYNFSDKEVIEIFAVIDPQVGYLMACLTQNKESLIVSSWKVDKDDLNFSRSWLGERDTLAYQNLMQQRYRLSHRQEKGLLSVEEKQKIREDFMNQMYQEAEREEEKKWLEQAFSHNEQTSEDYTETQN